MIRPPPRPVDNWRAAAMTPCIDVIFNLLIFVLCTSQLRSHEAVVESRLPGEVQPVVRETPEPAILRVRLARQEGDGSIEIRLDGRAVSRCAAPPAKGADRRAAAAWDAEADRALGGGFATAVSAALSDPESEVLLRADPSIPYDLVARCEDRIRIAAGRGAKGKGRSSVRIVYEWTATERPPGE